MKIAVIGGGFAGRAAARVIGQSLGGGLVDELVLIDRNEFTTMLPSLPDLAGDRVREADLKESIDKLIPSSVQFMQKNITQVNLHRKEIHFSDGGLYQYDYLVFAPGSKTNFYGNTVLPFTAFKMDCMQDALKIRQAAEAFINQNDDIHFVISGAGFTGIELATNLYHMAHAMGKKPKVTLVEVTNKVLPMLSEPMSTHVKKTVEGLGIEFLLEREVVSYENNTVAFKDGSTIPNAFYCWCAGVMTSVPLVGSQQETRDKRVLVDSYLRIPEHPEVFVAGDAAAVKDDKGFVIRRAVNFSATEGKLAGQNLVSVINKETLKPYKVVDLGWVIPLYVDSIGEALGQPLKGRKGIAFHYIMCGLKNYSVRNFLNYLGYSGRFTFTKAKH